MKNWIPKQLKKDRVRNYLLRKYGKTAFNKDGSIKIEYLKKAIKETNNRSLISALNLAIKFKHMKHKR